MKSSLEPPLSALLSQASIFQAETLSLSVSLRRAYGPWPNLLSAREEIKAFKRTGHQPLSGEEKPFRERERDRERKHTSLVRFSRARRNRGEVRKSQVGFATTDRKSGAGSWNLCPHFIFAVSGVMREAASG